MSLLHGAILKAACAQRLVLSTCVFRASTSESYPGQDFVPLLVDFKQSAAAVGKIPTNYLRRELGQTDADILASRVIDRSLRPLFPPGWTNETQQVPTEKLEEAIDVGLDAVGEILTAMDELRAQAGKEKAEFSLSKFPQDLEDEVRALCEERLYYILSDPTHDKVSRDNAIKEVGCDVVESIKDCDPSMVQAIFRHLTKKALRSKRPHKVLTDISGIEDYAGDMDFKIAGSSQGFTAMQLDVKIPGLTRQQLTEAFTSGKAGIDHVLDKMAVMIDRPREGFKPTVPVIESMRLDAYKRQALFRAGGMHAKTIEAETGVKVVE
ncbi:polyribonucleotide nucleotidyltransferase, RNA binding domain protein [Ancylostoma ceylanicum]|uniref:Polyribonucleotide nucleotidyltransferase, RNA binding domain protein n=1 Tax=Ancylostoma ceylanicum TaxID=53326 RepID=A0A0D6LI09_9BILA|nr:polyribonucleotide nucleotidyltransferase, RNA binding domain protein [Ancylostoma ceylanicum]